MAVGLTSLGTIPEPENQGIARPGWVTVLGLGAPGIATCDMPQGSRLAAPRFAAQQQPAVPVEIIAERDRTQVCNSRQARFALVSVSACRHDIAALVVPALFG